MQKTSGQQPLVINHWSDVGQTGSSVKIESYFNVYHYGNWGTIFQCRIELPSLDGCDSLVV